jgi:hypothetical protein
MDIETEVVFSAVVRSVIENITEQIGARIKHTIYSLAIKDTHTIGHDSNRQAEQD